MELSKLEVILKIHTEILMILELYLLELEIKQGLYRVHSNLNYEI